MPTTTDYKFGDIVLVAFPFTDQSASKRRPAVVVSSQAYNQARRDLIIMAVTSQLQPTQMIGEVIINDWIPAGLIKPSVIKPVITTIERKLVLKRMGSLGPDSQTALREAIHSIVG